MEHLFLRMVAYIKGNFIIMILKEMVSLYGVRKLDIIKISILVNLKIIKLKGNNYILKIYKIYKIYFNAYI
jgi:hypothetical protein